MAEPSTVLEPSVVESLRALFDEAAFVRSLGVQLCELQAGTVETELHVRPDHLQQDGFVHAGVLATLADHTAGGAAMSVAPAGHRVLSIEFKINMLRPATGRTLRCRATVLRGGKSISVVESEVFDGGTPGSGRLVAKATVTLSLRPG